MRPDVQEIAARISLTPGHVAAIKADLSMGTYDEKIPSDDGVEDELASPFDTTLGRGLLPHRGIECIFCGHTVSEHIGAGH